MHFHGWEQGKDSSGGEVHITCLKCFVRDFVVAIQFGVLFVGIPGFRRWNEEFCRVTQAKSWLADELWGWKGEDFQTFETKRMMEGNLWFLRMSLVKSFFLALEVTFFLKGLKTGLYYLRTKAAADAIKFTVDVDALKRLGTKRCWSSEQLTRVICCFFLEGWNPTQVYSYTMDYFFSANIRIQWWTNQWNLTSVLTVAHMSPKMNRKSTMNHLSMEQNYSLGNTTFFE